MRVPALDPTDFTDPTARALVERIIVLLRQDARDDWRPDILELAEEPWLQVSVARARAMLDDLRRLTDVQVAAEAQRVMRQLRLTRLAVEISESALLLEAAEPEDAPSILASIADKNRERAALWRDAPGEGGAALGKRVAIIPSRFRVPVEPFDGP
jgi:hypothetical protein